MAIELNEAKKPLGGALVEIRVSGRLSSKDYERVIPKLESLIRQHGKIDVLFEMTEFHGWEARAFWEDLKFDLRHYSDIRKLAVIGDKKWEEWMATICRPFTRAAIRFFHPPEAGEARAWLET